MIDATRSPHPYAHGELALVVDVADLDRAADFWTEALGYVREGAGSARYLSLIPASGSGIELLLQKVDDDKYGKNRLHLDLRTPDLAADVARIQSLGATLTTTEPITESGWRWHILLDPDENEFCILQPPEATPAP